MRAKFNTRLGVIAATVGSAVGLGNIWRFPYEAGVHGGGAFLLVNLFCVLILGIPVMCAEFLIGRHSGQDVCNAFNKFKCGSSWRFIGWMGLAASTLILGFYSVVAGWTVYYIGASASGFSGVHNADDLHNMFVAFSANGWAPLGWTLLFLALNFLVLIRGVEKGLEKISNILMPILFLILIAFTVNSLLLPEAGSGLEFLFKPDFSQLTPSTVLGAMGQAFFSLSLGLGCLITYSSYFQSDTPLVKTAVISAFLDTFVAIMAGMIIFPAVFTYGQEPAAGPQLVFEVLPSIFMNMPGGMVWAVLFFVLLFVASLTSTLSLFETVIAFLIGKGIRRLRAVCIVMGVVLVLATFCSLSFGPMAEATLFGLNFFDFSDYVSSNLLLPLGGMCISIFVGWIVDRKVIQSELAIANGAAPAGHAIVKVIVFCLKYIAPVGIGLVFVFGLL